MIPNTLPPGCSAPLELSQASVPHRAEMEDPALGWAGKQGADWTDPKRNPQDVEGLNESYVKRFGIERTKVNDWALQGVPRDATVLEVGCSHGAQLNALAAVGFTNLEGCDISAEAVKQCPWPSKVADGRSLPYQDNSCDVVMTAGTLMQIPPGAKRQFMAECYRVARRWVYGVEGASPEDRMWTFGGLIPPAWTGCYPDTIVVDGWKIVRSQWLHPIDPGAGKMSLRAYLLERE